MAEIKRVFDISIGILTFYWIILSVSTRANSRGTTDLRYVIIPLIIVVYIITRVITLEPNIAEVDPVYKRQIGEHKVDGEYITSIKLPGGSIAYRLCCYQTGRLGDQYCICGRAIDNKLIDYFATKNELDTVSE